MKQRIMIEIEADECVADEVVKNIEATALGQIAAHELGGYGIHKEILTEKISGELNVPSFLMQRPYDCRRKECKDRIYAKGAGV